MRSLNLSIFIIQSLPAVILSTFRKTVFVSPMTCKFYLIHVKHQTSSYYAINAVNVATVSAEYYIDIRAILR